MMLPAPCNECISDPRECKTCRFYGKPNIRDFFAGCALIGIMQSDPHWHIITDSTTAFEVADTMLKAREA